MMKKICLLGVLVSTTALAGCISEPAPYYGGSAPYYGGTYVPPYAYSQINVVGGGYYPYHHNQHIYSNYNNSYWHNQHAVAAHEAFHNVGYGHTGGAAPAASHNGEPNGDHHSGGHGGHR